jgi:hypothetical protein
MRDPPHVARFLSLTSSLCPAVPYSHNRSIVSLSTWQEPRRSSRALANHPSLVSLLSPFPTSLTSLASPYVVPEGPAGAAQTRWTRKWRKEPTRNRDWEKRAEHNQIRTFILPSWLLPLWPNRLTPRDRGVRWVSDRRAVHRSLRSLLPSRSATPAPRLFARGRRTAPLLVPRRSLITSPFGTGSARWTGAPHAVRRCLRRVVDIEWRAFP